MRIYRIMGYLRDFDNLADPLKCLGFVRSEAQAKKVVTLIKKTLSDEIDSPYYGVDDILSGKAGLIAWLNEFTWQSHEMYEILDSVMGE